VKSDLSKFGLFESQAQGVLPVAAYFGPEARREKVPKPALSGAMDGVANVAELIPLSPAWTAFI